MVCATATAGDVTTVLQALLDLGAGQAGDEKSAELRGAAVRLANAVHRGLGDRALTGEEYAELWDEQRAELSRGRRD